MDSSDLVEETTSTGAATIDTAAPEPKAEPESDYGLPDDAEEEHSDIGDAISAKMGKGPEVAEPGPVTPQHDAQLLADAQLIGFSRQEAESFEPAALEKAVRIAFRNVATAQHRAVERMAEPPKAEEFKIDLDPEEYDEKVIGTFQAMKEHYDKQIGDLREQTRYAASHAQETERQSRQQLDREFTAQFDHEINALGFDDLFGKGGIEDILGNENAKNSRLRVLNHMDMDADNIVRRGEDAPSQKWLFDRAVWAEFGDRLNQRQQQTLSRQVGKRALQILPRTQAGPRSKQATGYSALKDRFAAVTGGDDEHTIEDMVAE